MSAPVAAAPDDDFGPLAGGRQFRAKRQTDQLPPPDELAGMPGGYAAGRSAGPATLDEEIRQAAAEQLRVLPGQIVSMPPGWDVRPAPAMVIHRPGSAVYLPSAAGGYGQGVDQEVRGIVVSAKITSATMVEYEVRYWRTGLRFQDTFRAEEIRPATPEPGGGLAVAFDTRPFYKPVDPPPRAG